MKGKKGIVGIVVSILFIAGTAGFFLWNRPAVEKQPDIVMAPTTIPTPPPELATWEDQSEFTFQYPKMLSLDPHEEDKINYAHVELTSRDHPGRLIVWTKDALATNIDDWAKREKLTGAIDTTLAGIPAKKVLKSEEMDKRIVSAIRNGYLYQIEAHLIDADYWNGILDQVYNSFTFSSPEPAPEKNALPDTPAAESGTVEEEYIE